MKSRIPIFLMLVSILAIVLSLVSFSKTLTSSKNPQNFSQTKMKTLREKAMERDIEIDGPSGCDVPHVTLDGLNKESTAIVYGKINNSRSFFDETSPSEAGDYITTEYRIEILRVLKDTTRLTTPSPGNDPPALLTTPLKVARNGGVVMVNGHRASIRVKDFEELISGNKYVFFLNWSPNYKAYVLTDCALGAILVKDDLQLKSIGNSKELRAELTSLNLQGLFKKIE
jgi:hypothetical protein